MTINSTKHYAYADYLAIAFFCLPLVNYLRDFIPNYIVQLILYGIIYLLLFLDLRHSHELKKRNNALFIIIVFYVIFLGLRLFTDFIYPNKTFFVYGSPYTILFVYIFQILLPCIILNFIKFEINIQKIGKWIIIILTICVILSINKIIHGEVEVSNDGRFDNGYGIFSIEFGHLGVTLILVSYLFINQIKSQLYKIILIICIIIGFIGVAFAGSRSPFLAAMVCIAFYTFAKIKSTKKLLGLLGVLIVALPLILLLLTAFSEFFSSLGFQSFERIYDSFFGEGDITSKTSGRDSLYDEGIELFSVSPIFGYSFLIPGKIYVHNIFLEAFMGMGIFGGIFFLIMNFIGVRYAWYIIKYNPSYAAIPVLYIQYMIFGSFSTTIIALPLYWLFYLLTINIAYQLNIGSEHKLRKYISNY